MLVEQVCRWFAVNVCYSAISLLLATGQGY